MLNRPFAGRRILTILVLLLSAALVPGCDRATAGKNAAPGRIRTLNVLTPHSEEIRNAFAAAFATWHFASTGEQVHVNFIYRGTPQCVDYARSILTLRASGAPGTIPDVMFGGGINDHAQLVAERLSRPVDIRDERRGPIPTIQGMPIRDPNNYWFATGLSTFGILCNTAACKARGIEPPTTWADLADPRFYGWIAIADPGASGSHRECMVLMLKHLGWDDGVRTLIRVFANARALDARSGDALRQVRTGTALATFAVNFDGQALAADSNGALHYFDPPAATAATPDVISVLRCTQDGALAEAFVSFVLSEPGQTLWGVKPEARTIRGPALYHYPISPEIYEAYAGHLCVDRNPATDDFGVKFDLGEALRLGQIVTLLSDALCADGQHVELQLRWREILAGGGEKAAGFGKPPFTLETATNELAKLDDVDDAQRESVIRSWRESFGFGVAASQPERGS